jgi:hypothetical protein
MKKCSKCKEEREFSEFSKDKTTKDGYHHQCKSCRKELRLNNKEKQKKYYKEYYENNKLKKKEYFQKNKEKINEYDKKYRENNKEKINEKNNKYKKHKKQTNPLFKLRCNISTLIRQSISKQGYTKRSQTYKILGCTFEEFKLHLENQFKDGMSWENAGLYGWHLDHIYPVSLAKDEEELIKLNHYTNFQPLWAIDNIKKGNKIL